MLRQPLAGRLQVPQLPGEHRQDLAEDIDTYVQMYIYIYTHIYTHIYVFLYMYIYIYIYIFFFHEYRSIDIHLSHIHMHICIYMYIDICMCIHVHTCKDIFCGGSGHCRHGYLDDEHPRCKPPAGHRLNSHKHAFVQQLPIKVEHRSFMIPYP